MMKKIILGTAVVMSMIASVSVFATNHSEECITHEHNIGTTHVATQGARCTGTVGCNCSGFAPITSGDVWQQAYCKRCGHHRRYHR